MREDIKQYVEKNIHLIDQGNMQELYKGLVPYSRPYLTEVLLAANIYPLTDCKKVPDGFAMNINIDTVTLPDNCEIIGAMAFKGSTITSIEWGNSLREIDYEGFSFCHDLKDLKLPDSCLTVKDSTFLDCRNLVKVDLGKSLENIASFMFKQCYNLSYVMIPTSMLDIFQYAFSCCDKLGELHYEGTKVQWDLIHKHPKWDAGSLITRVICSDGIVEV